MTLDLAFLVLILPSILASPIVQTLTDGDKTVDMNGEVAIPPTQFDTRDKNWEITQRWLIQSMNRLRQEINELGHNYNVHIKNNDANVDRNQANFVHDIAVLRADHTVLANQQKEIINLIKTKPSVVLEKLVSPVIVNKPPDKYQNDRSDDDGDVSDEKKDSDRERPHRHHRRHPKVEKIEEKEEILEENLSKMSQRVNSLNEITLALFHGVRDLETKIQDKDDANIANIASR